MDKALDFSQNPWDFDSQNGPKVQIEAGASGGTPDHLKLKMKGHLNTQKSQLDPFGLGEPDISDLNLDLDVTSNDQD